MPIIAIVEDDASVRDALATLVELFDYDGRIFEGPEPLLADFAPGRFDCVVTDIRMPGMDGLELQRRLGRLEPALPVIVVTSYEDDATRRRAVDQGARAVLSKPVSAAILQRELEAALGRR